MNFLKDPAKAEAEYIEKFANPFPAAKAGYIALLLQADVTAADITPPAWRGSAIGIYRFWRDLGYGIGALGLGAAAALGGRLESAGKTAPAYRFYALPGGPPPDDPDNPTHLPVDPDDGESPSPVPPQEDEGSGWQPPV